MTTGDLDYSDDMLAREGRSIARLERLALCNTAIAVGSTAPTLSGEWDVHHLLAHLALRESAVGTLTAPISVIGDRAVASMAGRRSFDDLVERVRIGPPRMSVFSLPGADRRFNALEYFVHHEDIRRAQPDWTARALPTWAEDKLWRGLTSMAKLSMRKSPTGVTLVRTDTQDTFDAVGGDRSVRLCGQPSELVLYAFGRTDVTKVEIEGAPADVGAFREARFSV